MNVLKNAGISATKAEVMWDIFNAKNLPEQNPARCQTKNLPAGVCSRAGRFS